MLWTKEEIRKILKKYCDANGLEMPTTYCCSYDEERLTITIDVGIRITVNQDGEVIAEERSSK